MFEDKAIVVSGHIKGYITDGRIYPPDSVQDCLNMDFYRGRDAKRQAYSEKTIYSAGVAVSLNDFLPSGYTVAGFTEKLFVDEDNNSQAVLVIVAVHSSPSTTFPTKIYVSKYFNPSNTFYNYTGAKTNQISSTDWENNITELTEKVAFTAGSPSYTDTNRVNTITVAALAGKKDNYYHGWHIYSNDSNLYPMGCITDYNGTTGQIVIRRNSYDDAGTIRLRPMGAGDYILSRFQVNTVYYQSFAQTVSDVTFREKANTLQICLGKNIELLNLSFLQEKRYFGTPGGEIGSSTTILYKNWNGFYFAADAPKITDKKVYTWVEYVAADSGDINEHLISTELKELGVLIKWDTFTGPAFQDSAGTIVDEAVIAGGFVITLDGYQAVFLKNVLMNYHIGDNVQTEFDRVSFLFGTDYDRRISSMQMFYGRTDAFGIKTPYTEQMIELYQFQPDYAGDTLVSASGRSNIYSASHNLYEVWIYDIDGTTGNVPVNSEIYGPGGTASAFDLRTIATGLSLNSYLNNYYWKDIYTLASGIFPIGEDTLAWNLANTAVSTDEDYDKNGSLKGAISQIQQGFLNTQSIFVDERVRQITEGQSLTGGASTIGGQFLLFTETNCLWYNIEELDTFLLQKFQDFEQKGAYQRKGIIKAQFGDQFAGVYWIGRDSIYRFLNNAPDDLLFDRWRDAYQLISEADKRAASAGFLPRTREVYMKIGSYVYVWNIDYENWKIYSYGDVPAYLTSAINGEIMFSTGRYLFQPEAPGTTVFKDKNSTDIPFMMEVEVSGGDMLTNKIPHKVMMKYDVTGVLSGGEALQCQLKTSVTNDDKADGTVMDETFDIIPATGVSKKKKALHCTSRVRANRFKVRYESVAATDGNIKTFELRETAVIYKEGNVKGNRM